VTVEGESYDIDYTGDGVAITSAQADTDLVSLLFSVDVTEPGILEVTLDRAFFDSKYEGEDDVFFVLVDGLDIPYDETKTATSRTLSMNLPTGTEEVEIIGTDFVLEQPTEPEETPSEPEEPPTEPEEPPKETQKEIPASFVDPNEDPKTYVKRYITEPSYKKWFEDNYPNYTFHEALDITKSQYDKLVAEIKNHQKPTEPKTECGPGTVLRDGSCVVVCGAGTELVDGKCKAIEKPTTPVTTPKGLGKELVYGIIAAFVVAGAVGIILALMSKASKSKRNS
ncbi:MAG: hypothetical protein R3327_05880, partial [Nitrosopumilaceae archaeon]|nr:hypothetical protein [Nitrosopumilaceae archaeon]